MKNLTNTFMRRAGHACFALLLSALSPATFFAHSVWTGAAGSPNWNNPAFTMHGLDNLKKQFTIALMRLKDQSQHRISVADVPPGLLFWKWLPGSVVAIQMDRVMMVR